MAAVSSDFIGESVTNKKREREKSSVFHTYARTSHHSRERDINTSQNTQNNLGKITSEKDKQERENEQKQETKIHQHKPHAKTTKKKKTHIKNTHNQQFVKAKGKRKEKREKERKRKELLLTVFWNP